MRLRIFATLGAALLAVGISLAVTMPSHAAGGLSATYSRVQEWPGSYFQGQYVIANGTSAAVTSWTLTFTLPAGDQLQTAACRSGYQPATSARGACEAGSVSVPTLLVVDAANVVGSVPDGWW